MAELDWYLQINLKSRQLRLLVTIDTYRNLSQVAEVIHVSVPAVSKALMDLERGLGLSLFSRTKRGLIPTPYGECLIRHARSILATLQQARDELKALKSGTEGKVNIGMLRAASVLLPQALQLLKERSPGTNVMVVEGSTAGLLPQLWQGELDLVVGRLPPPDTLKNFEEQELFDEPVVLMTGMHHPLARKKSLSWSDLQPYPWILPPLGSTLRDALERVLEANEIALTNNYIETLSIQLARSQLRGSDYIAVMALTLANDSKELLHALPLKLPRLLRPAGVLWSRNRGLSPSAKLVVSCLQEVAERLNDAMALSEEARPARQRPRRRVAAASG
ncbi:LysR substrate-binding domain-containing protein [Pseudorhodoferax sp.]|uniref:LysR substrate-binding domain-containing protein n=1 Tax=Pseudorhodoferax sp. TaxID=1993553 RepID=UPI002DD661F7|nr:LysR substrate-binding domain-containing protein [Pseudorhodoferax sp.]